MVASLRLWALLRRTLRAMIGRSIVSLIDDSTGFQYIQLSGSSFDDIERCQQYGFTSYPLPGAEAVHVAVGADPEHAIVLAVDDRRYRLRGLAEGEVALYNDQGLSLILRKNGEVEINAKTAVMIHADLQVEGDIIAGGEVSDSAGSMAVMRDTYNSHTHTDPVSGSTGTPSNTMG